MLTVCSSSVAKDIHEEERSKEDYEEENLVTWTLPC